MSWNPKKEQEEKNLNLNMKQDEQDEYNDPDILQYYVLTEARLI